MAGCCSPPRLTVRPLSTALRVFNTQRLWAPCESGLNGRHGWLAPGEAAVDDVLPSINERQVAPAPALPLPSTANHEARSAGATYGLGAQEFTVSATQPGDRPIVRIGAGLCAREFSYRQPGNRPDGKFLAGIRRDYFTARFTVRLKGIPATDLDRSRRTSRWTFANQINALGPFSIAVARPRWISKPISTRSSTSLLR
jgi:hypothetical protein